jgi:phospholipase C
MGIGRRLEKGLTRRELLAAGAATGVASLSRDSLIQQALAAKPKKGDLNSIEHVIILIQENRSFDHYFGALPGVRGWKDAVATGNIEQPGYPVAGYEGKLLPFHLDTGGAAQCFPDITHDWVPQHEAFNGGAMDKWVEAHLADDGPLAGPATMGYYEQSDIPFYYALADAFTICDGYHCSVLGPTDPNRLYSMTATIDPEGKNGGPLVQTLGLNQRNSFKGAFTWETMPEALSAAGVTWKVYDGIEQGVLDNPLVYFANYQGENELSKRAFDSMYPCDFSEDMANGELPQVSWINTSADETEHPGFSTQAIGEYAVEKLLRRVLKHKKIWEKTAIFITWDENGGFFDHVAPPVAPPGTPGEYLTVPDVSNDSGGIKGPVGLGFRVPLMVVSPFSAGGLCCTDVFDHTSLLRFLETRFGVEVPNLSAWRRETTGDLTSTFNFAGNEVTRKPSLPHVALGKHARAGECSTKPPVTVPPNSVPQQADGERAKPSG